ncbi:(E)-4-hydroxy-3-methylbut-2-enyl-diphosphate synthase [Cytophagaceae bacterium DM2B3-1]|uniref:4-hydroxy-3-methylbut-2-en-1-yl diphosphate synthase (flavodoxin) n=1 Tax=Xanthocytophaga flava TaxID=3048013 RepID=A0ABT7CEV1_9BACT|nr:(E)-4-hydroxy-3-methylbut-2-enyl-diphosphate synthase [Xanthocytophaga flavus]MDJ1472259.1 (E)-4-hydroxy-3-methylbut-2-enyl-diphosphate synthase [Xanthocytophaga flavus]MDJ1492270.1 (E)-4-hydroxy-3-methylbut-2-enyl-diphosphate synthase [Xanthocytophaga flavus]
MTSQQNSIILNPSYCESLTEYKRRKTITVNIGDVPMGSDYPIRVQSMTTIDTMDTMGSVEQTIRMIESGCEYVRITAPSIKEAENLGNIRRELRLRGYTVPLVADIHFTPNAAELAARLVEKVRINPGNYADKKRFETIEYTDVTYQAELERIREKFIPLVKICKEYGTAMRIGTNHGSLSDRILSRYGDTPLGMVESALEFLRICEDMNYYNIVISMKASNTQVMVQAYRLLVQKLAEEGLKPYPLHLGVTEAGEAEDGRIKSAVGIGTLLEDGLGDTVRVSLTEAPELEAPVAQALIDRYTRRAENAKPIKPITINHTETLLNPYQYFRRHTHEVVNFGGQNVPRVIADFSQVSDVQMEDLKSIGHFYLPLLDKWKMNDLGADYIYAGKQPIPFMIANGSRQILDATTWQAIDDKLNTYPLFNGLDYLQATEKHPMLNFVTLTYKEWQPEFIQLLKTDTTIVLWIKTENAHAMAALRRLFFFLLEEKITCPVVLRRDYQENEENTLLYASTDAGGLLIDGLGDGILLGTEKTYLTSKEDLLKKLSFLNQTAFGILQAARTRMSKTEYISCPSCGRTLFDLQDVTAMIRKRTDHLKGIKIGIMGCIVNGPGEMADADYGYVGSGVGKITLYRGQNVVKKNVPSDKALDELIELIREDGRWNEVEAIEA